MERVVLHNASLSLPVQRLGKFWIDEDDLLEVVGAYPCGEDTRNALEMEIAVSLWILVWCL